MLTCFLCKSRLYYCWFKNKLTDAFLKIKEEKYLFHLIIDEIRNLKIYVITMIEILKDSIIIIIIINYMYINYTLICIIIVVLMTKGEKIQ